MYPFLLDQSWKGFVLLYIWKKMYKVKGKAFPKGCMVCALQKGIRICQPLFIHCSFSKAVWSYFFASDAIMGYAERFGAINIPMECLGNGRLRETFLGLPFFMVCYGAFGKSATWEYLKENVGDNAELVDSIIWEVGSWVLVSQEFKDIIPPPPPPPSLMFPRDWETSISMGLFDAAQCRERLDFAENKYRN